MCAKTKQIEMNASGWIVDTHTHTYIYFMNILNGNMRFHKPLKLRVFPVECGHYDELYG